MNCSYLTHKEAKLNALENLKKEGFIGESGRILNPDKRDEFQQYHNTELRRINSVYGLNIPALYEITTTIVGDKFASKAGKKVTERVTPIDSAFNQIDAKRKALGIYDEKLSFGGYKLRQKQNSEAFRQEMLEADLGYFDYNGEIYPSREDMEAAQKQDQSSFFMPNTGQFNPTNYGSVVSFKKNVLKKVEKALREVNNQRKTIKSNELKAKAQELDALKDKLVEEIRGLESDPDIFEKTVSVFNNDLKFISKLIANPTLENLDLAEYHLAYFETISDISSDNKNNTLISTDDYTLIEPDVKKELAKLSEKVKEFRTDINNAKSQYLLEVIEQTPNLQKMFAGSSLEEIRDIINEHEGDIGWVSKLFLSADMNFSKQKELLGQILVDVLKEAKSKNKVEANGYIQSLNNTEGAAKRALTSLGKGITYFSQLPVIGKLFSEVNYDMFYQKTSKGNRTGRLIGKFSHSWFKNLTNFISGNNLAIREAIAEQDKTKLNAALVNKYAWLNQNTDFIDLSRLPEIVDNPLFQQYSSYFNKAQADAYKAELIGKIGEYEYNRLVVQQTLFVEDFTQKVTNELKELMRISNVTNPSDLPLNTIHHYNIFTKRHSPFEFMNSHNSGQQGRVDYTIGTQGNQYQPFINYNTYIPKKQLEKFDNVSGTAFTEDSNYYDKEFEQIEGNNDLLKFWENASEAVEWMNSKISDSDTQLSHNSLLAMRQSLVSDVLLNKNVGIAKKLTYLARQTSDTFKSLFSTKIKDISADQTDYISKGSIQTIEEPVNQKMKIATMRLSRLSGQTVTYKDAIDLIKANPDTIKAIEEFTNKTKSELIADNGSSFSMRTLREYITNQVVQEQTFNLPVMLKAYLDAAGTYAAQKESLPKINILKSIYDAKTKYSPAQQEGAEINQGIREVRNSKGIQNKRLNSQTRMNYWINKSVKGYEDKTYWLKLGKNFSEKEEEFKKEGEAYLVSLNDRLSQITDDEEREIVEAEIADIKYILENLGHHYTAAAIYDVLINRTAILYGIGWNVKAQMMNRLQGIWSAMVHDTGRYWTPGNIYPAQAFVNRKGLRYIPGVTQYKHEVRKVKLLIQKLGVIQDATNELDRAKGNSGLRGAAKKVNPFYLVEYVEWHNQTPEVLAMLMDEHIEHPTHKDINGEPIKIPIFNGSKQKIKLQGGGTYTIESGLPAYNIEKGQLVLKPEFASDSSKSTWEDFSSNDASTLTKKIDTTLALINGDYRSDSNTYAKSNPFGRSLMGFKTWVAANVWTRFAKDQTNINLGIKDFDGAYTGSLSSSGTATTATTLLALGVTATVLTGGLGLVGGLITAGATASYVGRQAYLRKKSLQQDSQVLKQMAGAIQGVIKKGIGLPINIVSGKDLIKAHTFNELNISEKEKQNLRFMVNEMTLIMTGLLLQLMVKGAFGDDEDKEPKTMNKEKSINPYFYSKKEESKGLMHLAENVLTELIGSGSMFISATEMYDTATGVAPFEIWVKKAGKIGDAVIGALFTEESDIIEQGLYKGHSKVGIAFAEGLLPGVVTQNLFGEIEDLTLGESVLYKSGFGKQMEKDFRPNQIIDEWYDSDYKVDKREASKQRKEFKEERQEYWEKEFKVSELDDNQKVFVEERIKKIINKELEAQKPMPNRALYDENQNAQ